MTGLIYLVIIALWAAVLIPMWLRRHDQVSEVRSTTRFSTAMRSLGSQRSGEIVENRGSASNQYRQSAHERAAQRRTIVLGSLTALLAITLLLAVASVVPKWLPMFMAVLVAGFVVATAMTASQRTSANTSRNSARNAHVESVRNRRQITAPIAPVAPAAPVVEDDWENWNAWDDEESWEAVPSTLPTYVNSPRASVIPRPIDRNRPNEWDGEAMVNAANTMRRHIDTANAPVVVSHQDETAELPIVRAANG
ncbi:MAG: hypothetical protein F2641_06055 [Actinobacteria bacterium]|nr:hypothetical protein [Actinomycetota bacterium]